MSFKCKTIINLRGCYKLTACFYVLCGFHAIKEVLTLFSYYNSRTMIYRCIYPDLMPLFNIILTLSQLVTLTNDAFPVNMDPCRNAAEHTQFSRTHFKEICFHIDIAWEISRSEILCWCAKKYRILLIFLSTQWTSQTALKTPICMEISDILPIVWFIDSWQAQIAPFDRQITLPGDR